MQKVQAPTRKAEWLKAWSWLPVLLLLSWKSPRFFIFNLSAHWLVLPVALWLGHRYGRIGLTVVAFGALGLGLPIYLRTEYGSLPANTDVYVAALILAWLASKGGTLSRLAWRPASSWYLPLLLGLLALAFGLWGQYFGQGITVGLYLHFQALLYLLMFALGLSRITLRAAVGSVALATLTGILLEAATFPRDAGEWLMASRADLPLIGMVELKYLTANYILDTPREFLTATGYLLFGRSLRDAHARTTPAMLNPLLIITIVLGLLLLAMGEEMNDWLVNRVLEPGYASSSRHPAYTLWLGAAEAVPLVAMVAGRYLGYPGLLFLLAGVVVMWGLDGGLLAGHDLNLDIKLATPLYVFGFGTLGVQIRNQLEGRSTSWWSWPWAQYLLLVALVLYGAWPIDEQIDILGLCMAFVVVAAMSLALTRIWQWLLPKRQTHTGWLALATLCMVIYSVKKNYQAVWEALRIMVEQIQQLWALAGGALVELEIDNHLLITSLSLLCLGMVILCLQKVLEAANNLREDLVALRGILSGRLRLQYSAIKPTIAEASPQRNVMIALRGLLGRIGRVCVAASLLLPVAIGGQYAWTWLDNNYRQVIERRADVSTSSHVYDDSRKNLDPFLLKAVQSFINSWPTTNVRPGYGSVSYTIEWHQHPDYPDERLRIWMNVKVIDARRADLSMLERRERALTLSVTRLERGRFGLWLEPETTEHVERVKAIETEMRASILDRAEELAANAGSIQQD